MLKTVLILDVDFAQIHPKEHRYIKIGEKINLDIIDHGKLYYRYTDIFGHESFIKKKFIKILNDKFIDIDSIINLPENCFVRSKHG